MTDGAERAGESGEGGEEGGVRGGEGAQDLDLDARGLAPAAPPAPSAFWGTAPPTLGGRRRHVVSVSGRVLLGNLDAPRAFPGALLFRSPPFFVPLGPADLLDLFLQAPQAEAMRLQGRLEPAAQEEQAEAEEGRGGGGGDGQGEGEQETETQEKGRRRKMWRREWRGEGRDRNRGWGRQKARKTVIQGEEWE